MDNWITQRQEQVAELLNSGQLMEATRVVGDLHPADLASLIELLGEDHKRDLFSGLSAKDAAEVVVHLSDYSRDQVLEGMLTRRIAEIVDDLPSDEATDIIAELPDDQAQEILDRIDLEDSEEVRELLKYAEDTAGGIMQLEMVTVTTNQTVQEAIEAIREKADEVDDLHNVFVVDSKDRIMGVLPLHKLILAPSSALVESIMEECPLMVMADEDQESVAHKFRRYDVVSAPVSDKAGRLIGRITIDDVVDILEEEAQEDMALMAGFSKEEEVFHSKEIFQASRLRLPWLLSNMAGGLLSGWLLWMFKVQLADALFLIAFIPVIMAMAGNVGVQSSTIMVRGFAVGQIRQNNLINFLIKEVKVAMVIGAVCGLLVGAVALIWHRNTMLGLVVGVAMACSISVAALMGTLAPAMFKKINVDPAISSGPVVTTVNDIVGILIYFAIATIFYHQLIA